MSDLSTQQHRQVIDQADFKNFGRHTHPLLVKLLKLILWVHKQKIFVIKAKIHLC